MKWRLPEIFENAILTHGDCLDLLEGLGDESVDAVLIDPPYCSGARTMATMRGRGGMIRGEKWGDKPLTNDRMTATGFTWLMRQVSREVARILVPGGAFLSFIDWRQYPMLVGVMESSNFQIQNLVVWDKEILAMGNGFRNQHELVISSIKPEEDPEPTGLVVHGSKGTPNVYDRSTPNVIRVKRVHQSDIHPTEKPVRLYEAILPVVCDKGGTVVDCFMGSGPCAEAAHNLGMKFIGCEIEEPYFQESVDRMKRRLYGLA